MNGCRIFIGRLNPSAREKDVERFFKGYGRIRDIDLKRGFGFVEFDDPRDAEDAVYELDGKELCNERVTIEHARVRLRGGRGRGGGGASGGGGGRFPARYGRGSQDSRSRNPPPMRTENRLIVENLSSRVSWQDLKDFMRQAGEVTFADAHRPKLNEGVVEFASSSDLKNALDKLSGKEINGRKIRLIEANKKRSTDSATYSRKPHPSQQVCSTENHDALNETWIHLILIFTFLAEQKSSLSNRLTEFSYKDSILLWSNSVKQIENMYSANI
ncbi:serine and arginine rich splicing factor 5b isoform X2 [Alosa alosa]|nr:serine and arginine rich splicing factor 5b isoform X2 [Alosa alosa]